MISRTIKIVKPQIGFSACNAYLYMGYKKALSQLLACMSVKRVCCFWFGGGRVAKLDQISLEE